MYLKSISLEGYTIVKEKTCGPLRQRDRSEMGTQNILWPTHCRAAFRDLHYRLQGEIALAAKANEW